MGDITRLAPDDIIETVRAALQYIAVGPAGPTTVSTDGTSIHRLGPSFWRGGGALPH